MIQIPYALYQLAILIIADVRSRLYGCGVMLFGDDVPPLSSDDDKGLKKSIVDKESDTSMMRYITYELDFYHWMEISGNPQRSRS